MVREDPQFNTSGVRLGNRDIVCSGHCYERFFFLCAFGGEKTLHLGWLAQAGECSRRAQPHRPHLSPALKSSSILMLPHPMFADFQARSRAISVSTHLPRPIRYKLAVQTRILLGLKLESTKRPVEMIAL